MHMVPQHVFVPSRTDPPPKLYREHGKKIIWTQELVAMLEGEAASGRSAVQTAKWLGVCSHTMWEVSKRFGLQWQKARYLQKEQPAVSFFIDPDRQRAGADPLPPGHKISWGSISHYAFR